MSHCTKFRLAVLFAALFFLSASAAAQEPRKLTFRAVNYDVHATLIPEEQLLEAKATVELEARDVSRIVEVELHPNLKITAVTGADSKPLPFERDASVALRVRVSLPEAVAAGQKVKLNFAYSGPLANEENSPIPNARLAAISTRISYLLLPARWFPLTDFPANRFTGAFHITVPQGMSVVGTGNFIGENPAPPTPPAPKGQQPAQPSPARTVSSFKIEQPEAAGSFVIGNVRVVPVTEAGLTIPVYVPADAAESAALYGQSAAQALAFFSEQFGALPRRSIAIAQLPDDTVQGYSAPGLLLINRRQWTLPVNHRLLARLAAGQWWGNAVLPATPNDALLSDGLARYCEALLVLQQASEEGFNKALEEFAIGALMFEEEAPIAQASRLTPFSGEYRSIVMNKGALVLHMLRAQLGADAFGKLLRDFYAQFAGKSARLADFQQLAQKAAEALPSTPEHPRPNIGAFFTNWVNSTGLPEFKVTFVTYRVPKGFRIVGKVQQELETFRTPLQIRVLTDGNPEMKTIEIIGRESDFTIETFGRPKQNGLQLDPNNQILKSSPRLRLRAAIARGEELAAEGRFFDAIQEYQQALALQQNNSLANFRMGEAFFYQKNYQAAANAFRDALEGQIEPTLKWIEVWSHIYIGKIFDLSGQRERALNEYNKAQELNDDTGGALKEIERWLKEPYKETPGS